MSKITLELTPEQAVATSRALDLFMRVGLGQLEAVTDLLQTESLHVRNGQGQAPTASLDTIADVEYALLQAKKAMGHDATQSFGITNENVHIDAKRAYEVNKVLNVAVLDAFDRNVTSGVTREGLTLRVTDDPVPKATVS